MKISSIRYYAYRLPTKVALRVRGRVLNERRGFLIHVAAGDAVGWGEAAPLPGFSPEDMDHVYDFLQEKRPSMLEADWGDGDDWAARFDGLLSGGVASGRFGLETAVLDLHARRARKPLREILSPGAGSQISLNALLTADAAQDDAALERVRSGGFASVKIKVGRADPLAEAAQISAIADKLGTATRVRLDANRAWLLADAVRFAKGLGATPIEYVEEPLQRPTDIPLFTAQTGLRVALDETLSDTPRSVWESYESIAALVIKPTILGGLARASRFAQLARQRGWRYVVSSAFESGVGTKALAELAAAFSGVNTPVGLDTYRLLEKDVIPKPLDLQTNTQLASWPDVDVIVAQLQPVD